MVMGAVLALAVSAVAQGPAEQRQLESRLALHSIYFQTARPTASNPSGGLVASQQAVLMSLADDFKKYLKFRPEAHLILGGHTDPRGSIEYNKALTERRVERTKRFLVEQGVPASSIETRSFGKENQLTADQIKELIAQDPDLSPADRQQMLNNMGVIVLANNRRVDVSLSTTGQQSTRLYPFNAEDYLALIGLVPPPAMHFDHPIWNVWQEDYEGKDPTFKHVSMQQNSRYLVTVNLAALRYSNYEAGVYSAAADDSFEKWVEQNGKKDIAVVTVLAIPDERFFDPLIGSESVRPLRIDLKKLREAKKHGFTLHGSPFEHLARQKDKASFSFGMASFSLRTKPNITGNASISFSIWDEDKPIGEISYWTCIDPTGQRSCEATPSTSYSLRGVDLSNRSKTPDGTLHFIELGTDHLVGVFRCNTCEQGRGQFFHWKLRGGTSWFHQQFEKTVLGGIRLASNGPDAQDVTRPLQSVAYNETNFRNAADAMYGLLFLSDGSGPTDAETAFQSFVAEKILQKPTGQPPPSLFVRFIPAHPDQAFIVPLALMRVPVTADRSEYLGFHFRVQTPLPRQDYSNSAVTLSKWIALVPPSDLTEAVNPLARARDQFKDWIELLSKDKSNTVVYDDADKFGTWLKSGFKPPYENQVVMILSHHDQKLNTLFIDPSISVIFPTNMRRQFANPSVAIIDACGAADPGAFEWVKNFNLNGMNTVIASSIEVDARMGGDFLRLLAEQLDAKSSDKSYTIERAFFDAIGRLRSESDGTEATPIPYGPRALIFNLVGSGNVHVQIVPKPQNNPASANSGV